VQIAPRYDGPPIIAIDGAPGDVRDAFIRQRARLDETLASFTDEQWRTQSRCDEWTAQGVVAHLVGTNQFWSASIAAGLKGSPTRRLGAGFDPKATPAALVEAMQSLSPAETYAQLHESNVALLALAESLDDAGWSTIAEAPPGHLPIRLVAHHALWDAWVHERDILLPLGITPVEEDDEVLACLRYGVALGPAFSLSRDVEARGTLVADVTEPNERIVATVADGEVRVSTGDAAGDAVLTGRAVDVLEQLSIRTPFPPVAERGRWLVAGLAEVFETA
jgi:uncharacterized protein (TIGR03083 family)